MINGFYSSYYEFLFLPVDGYGTLAEVVIVLILQVRIFYSSISVEFNNA